MPEKIAANAQAGDPTLNSDHGNRHLPECCVEYFLFTLNGHQLHARDQLVQLGAVQKAALHLSQSLTKKYLWQRDDFCLEMKNENGKLNVGNPRPGT